MKIYTLLFTLFFLLYTTIGNSFIGWISVWEKNNCRLYCYADYHKLPTDGYNEDYVYNQSHKEAIETVLSACDRDNCKIIIEDVRGYCGNHPGIKQHQQIVEIINHSSTSPLLGLYAHCEEHKIPTFNIEYRFGRNVYIDNLLDPNSITKILISKEENLVTNQDLLVEIQDTIKKIEKFNDDDPKILQYYRENLNLVKAHFSDFEKLLYSESSFEQLPSKKRSTLIRKILGWDVRLLDVKTIHELRKSQSVKKIGLFLGAGHVSKISSILESLQFKKIKTIGKEESFEYPTIDFNLESQEKERKNKAIALDIEHFAIFNK